MAEFETDEQGNIVLKPVTGWTIHGVGGVAIVVAVQYADRPEDVETEDTRKRIQFVLNPDKALELAEALKRGASSVLGSVSPDRPN